MPKTLNELAKELFDAKREEDAARKKRIEVEEQIIAIVEPPENGSKTADAGDGLKVTCKRELAYQADIEAIRALDMEELPLKLIPPVPASYELDKKAYEALREKSPTAFAIIAKHVTTKPRKPSVELKLA